MPNKITPFLYYPIKDAVVSQGFGMNFNNAYTAAGLKGHPALDIVPKVWGTKIYSAVKRGTVYKIVNKDNKDLSLYRAVFQLVQVEGQWFEVCYGHCNDINCERGDFSTLTVLGTVGNTGEVYSGGKMVTLADKLKGSKAGFHLHFQLRAVQRVAVVMDDPNFRYLTDNMNDRGSSYSGVYKDKDGFAYLIPDFKNGFNGCVDPTPYFNGLNAEDVISGKTPDFPEVLPTLAPITNAEIQVRLNALQKFLIWFISSFKIKIK